jgi:hypothetical protein
VSEQQPRALQLTLEKIHPEPDTTESSARSRRS